MWPLLSRTALVRGPQIVRLATHRTVSTTARLRFALPSHWGANKTNRNVRLAVATPAVPTTATEAVRLQELREAVRQQGDHVRTLKAAESAPADLVRLAIDELKARKKHLAAFEAQLNGSTENPADSFDRFRLDDLLRRRFFYDQSFAIYGGVSGQFDLGPMGAALAANLLAEWRAQFIGADGMLELECSVLTPEPVLRASGHLERFVDLMVRDTAAGGECYRLDHLLKQHFAGDADISARIDAMDERQMRELLAEHDVRAPGSGNALSEPIPFNLMFATEVGADSNRRYLRPETAQGMFVNYERLLRANGGRLPMAVAQIGNAFRNEIAPRGGLLRVREFTMAEIEHFCAVGDEQKRHGKFAEVAETRLRMCTAADQNAGRSNGAELSIGEAIVRGWVSNETLGYYLAKCQRFLVAVGIRPDRIRFRQHTCNEMAHYASDCWDAEILTSYGWIECVGCADRSAYDLRQHAQHALRSDLAESALPTVIEPSFGIGRILYALLEHSFDQRSGDEQRSFLRLPASVAPLKCVVLPLLSGTNSEAGIRFRELCERIADGLSQEQIVHRVDASAGSIGRRYARSDEIGVPFAVTVDHQTLQEDRPSVTIRHRDSMEQTRIPADRVPEIVRRLCSGELSWMDVREQRIDLIERVAVPAVESEALSASSDAYFFEPSFAMYGRHSGQIDLGPSGCALKSRILSLWNERFVRHERMLSVRSSSLMPDGVFRPETGTDLLRTPFGPTGTANAFLRPDASIGIYANFKRLLECNAGKLPFSVAQVANAFRNVSRPTDDLRSSYEFTLADFVHFYDPLVEFVGGAIGEERIAFGKGEMDSIENLLRSGEIPCDRLAYYFVRVADFLRELGISSDCMRFQSGTEPDTWNVEIRADTEWLKCVRFALRGTADLDGHSRASGVRLSAERTLSEPREIDALEFVPNRPALKRVHRKNAKHIEQRLRELDADSTADARAKLTAGGAFMLDDFALDASMLSVQSVRKTVHVEDFVPHALQVSTSIGRLLHAVIANRTNLPSN